MVDAFGHKLDGPVRPLSALLDHPIAVAAVSAAASLALLWRHVTPLGGIVEPGGDYGLMAWNLWIVDRAVSHGENPYFTSLVYHPLGSRLVRHTLVLGYWPVTLLTRMATRGDPLYPLCAYRLSILLSFTLALAIGYALLRRLGFARGVACVPALAYAFCDFNLLHVPHLNHLSAAFLLPLAGWTLVRLFEEPRTSRALAAALVLAAGVYFTELVVFIWMAAALALGLAVAVASTRPPVRRVAALLGPRGMMAAALAFVVVLAPFAVNWLLDSGKAPNPRQAGNWSANLAAFVIPRPATTPLYGTAFARADAAIGKGIGGQEVFLGFPLLALAAVGLVRRPRGWTAIAVALAAFFAVLSLGPTLKAGPHETGWPMPYALLMKVPPFEMGRTPVRCVLLTVFFLVFPAAVGLGWLADRVRIRWGAAPARALVIAVLVWTAAEVYSPGPVTRKYTVPAALRGLVPGPAVNVPLSVFDGRAVFLQMFHGHPIATGFVSRRTPAQVAHVRALDRLLEEDPPAFLRHLQRLGVTNVILGPGTPPATAAALLAGPVNAVDLRDEAPVH